MTRTLLAVGVVLLLAPTAAVAQGPDVTGMWDLTASFTLAGDVLPSPVCEYAGTGISLTQVVNDVNGTVTLDLTSGPTDTCPGQMTGSLSATVTDSSFKGTLDGSNNPGGDLGTATVSGTLTSTVRGAWTAAAALNMSGSATVGAGPFANASGTFSGQLAPAMPAMGPLALAALALILLGGSTLLLLRRRA